MNNGIVVGLSALAGVWMGWYAIPVCLLVVPVVRTIEQHHQPGIFFTCAVFAAMGAWRSVEPPQVTNNQTLEVSTGAIGRVSTFPVPAGSSHRVLMEIDQACIADTCIDATGRIVVYIPEQIPTVARGQLLKVDWRFDTLESLPPGYRSFVRSQGAIGSARATRTQLVQPGPTVFRWIASANRFVSDRIETLLPGETGALANGIVTGDDSRLSPETRMKFQATNTSHLTAVSGQNVAIIMGFLSVWHTPTTPWGRNLFHTMLILAVWSFTLFVGMQAPALRAALLATLMIIGRHTGRRADPIPILALILGGMAMAQPLLVHAVGFWLSATASMALCFTLPHRAIRRRRRALVEIALGPMVASVVTMPIVLGTFGTWSPVGILTNMLLAPIMSVAFFASYLFTILAVVAPGIAAAFTWVPGMTLDFAFVVIDWMAPISMQIRIDALSPILLLLIWAPIIFGIALVSDESDRWIRRILMLWGRSNPKPTTS